MDIEATRYQDQLPKADKLRRMLWSVVWLVLFRPTPRWCLNSWRIFLLKLFGAEIGKGCRIFPDCYIWAPWNLKMGQYSVLAQGVDCYSMATISIGDRVTVSQRSFLCAGTHDISRLTLPLDVKPIFIHDFSWVCAESFIGPGVSLGRGCVVGARAVVMRNVSDWDVVAGNPAKIVKVREVIDFPKGEVGE